MTALVCFTHELVHIFTASCTSSLIRNKISESKPVSEEKSKKSFEIKPKKNNLPLYYKHMSLTIESLDMLGRILRITFFTLSNFSGYKFTTTLFDFYFFHIQFMIWAYCIIHRVTTVQQWSYAILINFETVSTSVDLIIKRSLGQIFQMSNILDKSTKCKFLARVKYRGSHKNSQLE